MGKNLKVTFLGTGTSTGVPVPGCECRVCLSSDRRNKRLRTSIFIEGGRDTVLVDTSTDLRQQTLQFGYRDIDAVFYTHAHADHIMGIDDLRGFNFRMQREIRLFADDSTADRLEQMFAYAFLPDPNYQGGAPPRLELCRIAHRSKTTVGELTVEAIPIFHGTQTILGFRVGGFAYLTDCSGIPEESRSLLQGLDTLVVSGLRHRLHPTHFTVSQAIAAIEELNPKRAFLTHLSHELDHEETGLFLAEKSSKEIRLAHDGLVLNISEEGEG